MEPLRIIIVDDHPAFVEGLNSLLASTPSIDVVATAADGREAILAAAEHQPDVMLMDLHMPQKNGIEATHEIHEQFPDIAVLVLTMLEDDESVLAAMHEGARGYLLKGSQRAEIVRAVETVGNGGAVFGRGVALGVLASLEGAKGRARLDPSSEAAFPQLTERERHVLGLIAEGNANPEIAEMLTLSQKTVRNHVSNIFAKLQVADRSKAIVMAREAGLGTKHD